MTLPWARFAFAIVIPATVLAFFQIFDPAISHSLAGIGHGVFEAFSGIGFVIADSLGRHPFETTFSIATVVPLAVPTRVAWQMLGISPAYGWRLIADGELDSYLEGRVRKVAVASIEAYVERKLAGAKKDKGPLRTEKATAASVAKRAKRKATAAASASTADSSGNNGGFETSRSAPPVAMSPVEPSPPIQPASTADTAA
jgi:hypothetical protein